jgi:hypothetical protein
MTLRISQLKLLLFGCALVLVTCVLALTGYRLSG